MTQIDDRPAGLDLLYRAGNPVTVRLVWPDGYLTGRTYTTSLGALTIDDDTMTVAVDAEDLADDDTHEFVLTDTTDDDVVVIEGSWGASTRPAAATDVDVDVTVSGTTVTVDVSGAAALASLQQARGIAPEWDVEGWDAFTPLLITAHGSQTFTTSVVSARGVVTAGSGSEGNMRMAYVLDGTVWEDSELTSLILPPSTWNLGPQQGHIHRVRDLGGGLYTGIAVWNAIVGGGYETLNTRPITFDGTTLTQGGGDAASAADFPYIDRQLVIVGSSRTTGFGLYFNNLSVVPTHLYGMAAGDIVTVDSADSTMDATNEEVNGASTGNVQLDEVTTTSLSALAVDKGTVHHTGTSAAKRFAPFWLSTRVRGSQVEIKRWRYEDPEPHWGDARVRRPAVSVANGVEVPTEAGACALWAAHGFSSSTMSWGPVRAREL